METNLFPVHYILAVRLDLAQPLVGWWLTLRPEFPRRKHPFSISSKTGFALRFPHHDLSPWQAECPWPTLYSTSFSHQRPKAALEGRANSSFQRPQWAESATVEQGKWANIFSAAWSPPFQRDVSHGPITNKSRSHYPSQIQPMQTTPKSLILSVSNSRYVCIGLWQRGQDLKFV